jgi:TolB-like protein/DNA-binding winged helix-turn-helix (wHTH) protein
MADRVTFGVFEFDPASGILLRRGRSVRLQRQPARMLAALVARPGEIVDRATLQSAIWGTETNVDFERGLNFCVAQIRSALGDSAASPRYIETVPRRGYRFIAPAKTLVATTGSGRRAPGFGRRASGFGLRAVVAAAVLIMIAAVAWTVTASRAATNPPRIVVVPFDNETGSPEFDRVAKSLSDIAVAQLATPDRMPKLRVIGNATVRFSFVPRDLRAIGDSLGARYILLGQVKRDDRRIRVIAHLIRSSDQTHLWAHPFDRTSLDLPTQTELAESIAVAVVSRVARDN